MRDPVQVNTACGYYYKEQNSHLQHTPQKAGLDSFQPNLQQRVVSQKTDEHKGGFPLRHQQRAQQRQGQVSSQPCRSPHSAAAIRITMPLRAGAQKVAMGISPPRLRIARASAPSKPQSAAFFEVLLFMPAPFRFKGPAALPGGILPADFRKSYKYHTLLLSILQCTFHSSP